MQTLYTLGYTGIKPAQLLAKVEMLGAIVLDVRYSPRSRAHQWNGIEMARLLGQHYQHVPALGNINYKSGGPVEINMPQVGVPQVMAILAARSAILLCACPDHETCHRSIVAGLVQAMCHCEVIHLGKEDLRSGTPKTEKPQQLDLF
jgi:uncharacterized protein (DUF488 family)